MDIGTLRGLGTVVIMVAFIGLVIWAYSGKRKKSFDEATMLPFADDPEAKSTSSKLLGVTKNDDLLESVHYSSHPRHLLALTWLIFATRKGQRSSTTDETVGHSYDGIEEYDNPLPKWWFMLFVGTLVFAVGYLALYPAWAPGKA